MPTSDMNLPLWSNPFVDIWTDLFWEETWREADDAIAYFEEQMIGARYSYIKEGMILKAFEYYKWYTDRGFKTFRQYCEKFLKKSYYAAKKTIKAAQTSWSLLLEGFTELPDNVSQADQLKTSAHKVSDEYGEIFECRQKVLETSQGEGRALTTNYIEKTITGEETKPMANIQIPRSDRDELAKIAKEMGKSPQELLQEVVKDYLKNQKDLGPESEDSEPTDDDNKVEKVEPEKEAIWWDDLQLLLKENHMTAKKNYDTTSDNSTIS